MQGNKYVANLFFGGVSADVSPELLDSKSGTVIEAHGFGISRLYKNILRVIRGDKSFAIGSLPSGTTTSTIHFIGGTWLNGTVVLFYRDTATSLTYVYANVDSELVLIAQHADLPRQMFDIDTLDESSEMVITDNVTVPIVLNLNEMLAAQVVGELTYFDDYDYKLYNVNKSLQLNQPVFVQLEDLGAGGGLKVGSYAYSVCYSSKSGENTPWGPITPYIPVPESAVSLLSNGVESFAAGLKTWGGESSFTPGRYGIRLKLRITNLSGFDYIKIKRLANNTGQPISYTPAAEFTILTTDASGGLIDIKTNSYDIIEFVDSDTLDWAILDDSVTQAYSTIKTARTARFYDRRIILGGIEYESKVMSEDDKSDMFLTELGVNRIAFPVVKLLDLGKIAGGFSSIYNQVYNKSHRLGEKYGFGIKLNDEQGNTLFTVPIKHGEELKDDFTDFQFPNRRDKIPVGVARVDSIVLSGTIGSANIEADGVTTVATFHSTLTQTARDFVTDNAAAYIGGGVIVTSYGSTILFRSTVAGVDFGTDTSITPIGGGDLAGTVTTTQANVPPVRQEDLVLFGEVAGTATIVCSTSIASVSRTISTNYIGAITAVTAFVADYYDDFHRINIDISVDVVNKGVKLTGPITGAPITTTASGILILATDAVTHPVLPVLEKLRIDTITFGPTSSTPAGAVDITCGGITRTMTWHMSWGLTISEFLYAYGADYLPIVASSDILQVNKLFFTGSFSEATTVVPHAVSNLSGTVDPTQPFVAGASQIDDIAFIGAGGLCTIQCDVTGGGSQYITVTGGTALEVLNAFLAEESLNHGWAAIGVTISTDGSGKLRFTGPEGKPTTITGSEFAYDYTTHIQDSSISTAQIDTITLTGTVGNAMITCGGLSRSITYTSSKSATATKFYTDYQSLYAAVGIDILNSGDTIIFTALDADIPFTTTIVNVVDTLTGVPVITQAAASPIAQVDVVTLLGTSGTANITCQGVTHSVTFSISLDITAINFYTNFHVAYAAIGVTVGYSGGTITFTGPSDGTAIVTTATGDLVDNIYTIVSPVYGTAQIDKVTITGASGNANIISNGVTRGVTYITSPTLTASRFVEQNAAAYLPQVEVTSIGADVFFRVLRDIGIGLTGVTTIINTVGTLDGTPEHITDNSVGSGEGVFSPDVFEDSTIDSWAGEDVGFVYDPVKARRLVKSTSTPTELNIVSVADPTGGLVKPYEPITPTGRGNRLSQNKYDDIINVNIMDTVDTVDDFGVGQYGKFISTVGLRLGGIDTTKLPASVKSFSVVRTPAAGRVVCQGIGMYALTEQTYDATNPALVKALNKLWFYSPELDSVIGNKSHIYEDIKTNPSNYTIQLVAPCGFFSDFYSSYVDLQLGRKRQDFVSMPICGAGADARPMFPPDSLETNYISFGKWRNETLQGTGLVNNDLTFTITGAQDVPHAKIRVPYLELTLSTEIYANEEVKNESSSTAQSKEFHEPWYIINIIQNKSVPNNNINSYNDIGHSIRLESILGLSNGEASQTFPLVEERPEDVYSLNDTETTYRYIWVDGLPWLDSNNLIDIATYLTDLEAAGEFTPTNGLKCYGIYTYDLISNSIIFDQVLPTSLALVVPISGAQVAVKYNSNSPIEVFLGDTYVADASFLAVDTKLVGPNTFTNDGFVLHAPMPHYNFEFKTSYHQMYVTETGAVHTNIWEDQGTHNVGLIRQWLINFTCESSVNLPLAYKNFFPNRLYAMRPALFTDKLESETIAEYFVRMNIYPEYNDDYPDEYLNWGYGGLFTPASVNYDYEKLLPTKSYAEPKSGANELLSLMKRFHWSTQNKPGYSSNKVFLPTNIYDLKNDKASQISILYDDFSERGSNLYVITDRGAGMLLTDKQMITTAEGNNLTILAQDASLIKGEVWLNSSIGCPKEFWRGKSEGSIKLPNNIVANILIFPSQDDIVMLSNNNFVQIADNNRQAILTSLETVDLDGDFITKLFSVIDQGENKLWITIDTVTYAFNFDQNNWDGSIKSISFDKSFNAKYLTGVDDRNVLAHALNKTGQFGVSISHKAPDRFSTIGDVPYVVFSVTPELGRAVEFIDMFISASDVPFSIEMSTNKDLTNSVTVLGTVLQEYKPGLYYMQRIPRTPDNKVIQAKTMFVKIKFAGTSSFYDLRLAKIGYKLIAGN